MSKTALRSQLLKGRRRIGPADARRASLAASVRAWHLPPMRRAQRIALYFPMRHELDCQALMEQAWARGREVYLPVLHGRGLRFRRYTAETPLVHNRFGIPEPATRREVGPAALDVAITPLVGFDVAGTRLGMGGGFYDQTFHFLTHRRQWRRPKLVGFAFEMQRVTVIESCPWDVPLDAAVTESATYEFRRRWAGETRF
jgi:5-formyltetrahydrofolate cyclo-ligase